jgi:formamidopyrimidine-DNA glycosylase
LVFIKKELEIIKISHARLKTEYESVKKESELFQSNPETEVFAEDSIQCDRCGSITVIRYGQSAGKQTYYCKDCRHKFTPR